MLIVSTNPASTMNLHLELFCIMIYQPRFPARWLTQLLLSLASELESNPIPSQVSVMMVHVKISASVHVPNRNTIATQTLTQHNQLHPSNNKLNKRDKNISMHININDINNKHEELKQPTHTIYTYHHTYHHMYTPKCSIKYPLTHTLQTEHSPTSFCEQTNTTFQKAKCTKQLSCEHIGQKIKLRDTICNKNKHNTKTFKNEEDNLSMFSLQQTFFYT